MSGEEEKIIIDNDKYILKGFVRRYGKKVLIEEIKKLSEQLNKTIKTKNPIDK
jgi:hypothetical protein